MRHTKHLGGIIGAVALAACGGQVVLGGASDDGGAGSSSGTNASSSGAGSSSSSGGVGGSSSSSGGAAGSSSSSGGAGSSSSGSSGVSTGGSSSGGGAPNCDLIPGRTTPPAGQPVVLAHVPAPSGIALDATSAYVASYEIGPVYRVPLDGSPPVELDTLSATTVAINSTSVFTVSPNGGDAPQGLVVGCAKTGCNGSYTTLAAGQTSVWGVAADDTSVYWTMQSQGGVIAKAPVGGGATTVLGALGPAGQIVVSLGTLFYSGATSAQPGHGGLLSVSTDGGQPAVLVAFDPGEGISALTVDCSSVYYVTSGGDVMQVPRGGGAPTPLAIGAQANGLQLAVDASRVYFSSTNGLATVPLGGGSVTVLAPMPADGLAVDADNVYWTNLGAGEVLKLAK